MSEETSLTGEVIKQSKEVLGKAYDDLVHPTAEPVGNIISLIPRTINVWLGKWQKWIINGEESIRLTAEAVKEKAAKIPEEKLTEPEPYVAIPAIQQLSYCYDSAELREMYANLLVASMNSDTKYQVHPSFVDIIRQLTPDEAKLLKKISEQESFPLIDLHIKLPNDEGYIIKVHHFSNLAEGICDCPEEISSYLENYERLGIIEIPSMVQLTKEELYIPLETHPAIKEIMSQSLPSGYTYEFSRGKFQTSAFGRGFINICVSRESETSD